MERISSIKDTRIVAARALSSGAGRLAGNGCLLEGEQIIDWALAAGLQVDHVLVHDRSVEHPLTGQLATLGVPCYAVSEGVLKKVTGRRYLVPLVGVARLSTAGGERLRGELVVVLDDVRDQGNIGTIVRSACGFGVRELVATRPDLDLWARKTIEASRGKVFEVSLQRHASPEATVTALRAAGYQIVATSPHAPVLQSSVQLAPKPVALVVGNEGDGVCQEIMQAADLLVRIPLSGRVESLNVGVAAGISLYEIKFKMVVAMLVNTIRATLGREVNVAGKLLQMALDRALRQVSSLSGEQVVLMMVLKCDRRMTLAQVSKDTAAHGDELDGLLEPLYAQGLIVGDPAGEAIVLTEAGEGLLGQLWGLVETSEDAALAGFTAEERAQLRDFLQRIQQNCQALLASEE